MQIRYSTCIGMDVLEDSTGAVLGSISGILLHPDTGKVEGFFAMVDGEFGRQELFVSEQDILSLGTCMYVRSADVFCDPVEIVRLESLLRDDRTVLGQRLRTAGGAQKGRCADIQFDTKTMMLQWLFPKKLWRWGAPITVKDILEVRSDAIILRDPAATVPVPSIDTEEKKPFLAPAIPDIPETGMTMHEDAAEGAEQ